MTRGLKQLVATQDGLEIKSEICSNGKSGGCEEDLRDDEFGVAPGWWLLPAVAAGVLCWYAIIKFLILALS